MQSAVANYGETNKAWSGAEVKGFTKIFSNQTKLYYGLKDA
jgi:argininosuccinate synthase